MIQHIILTCIDKLLQTISQIDSVTCYHAWFKVLRKRYFIMQVDKMCLWVSVLFSWQGTASGWQGLGPAKPALGYAIELK